MSDGAATERAGSDCGAVAGGSAGDGGGETEAIRVEGGPLCGSDVAEETVERGFSEEEAIGDCGGGGEIAGSEQV